MSDPENQDREARPVIKYKPDGVTNVRKKPPLSELRELTEEHLQLIELMVYGLDEGGEIDGVAFEAGKPLSLRQAARAIGVRLRQARELHMTTVFQTELNKAVKARRDSERARNLTTAIKIRDEEGANTAADRTVRLKAIRSIEERDGPSAVNVQVNNQTNVNANIRPGYVIRLKSRDKDRAGAAKAIDGTAIENSSQSDTDIDHK